MIDTNNPIALPFRVNWATDPETEYSFRTGIITAADGSEQRYPTNKHPEVTVRFSSLVHGPQVSRVNTIIRDVMNSAVAIRDFRMNGVGRVSMNGDVFHLDMWTASWAVGVRVVIEDNDGLVEHTSFITSVDPASKTISIADQVPNGLLNKRAQIGSAVVATLDNEISAKIHHGSVREYEIQARSFRGLDPIGGATQSVFPFRHGSKDAMSATFSRNSRHVDFGIGRRVEVLDYDYEDSGYGTYQVETYQLNQTDKETLVSFFCGCRGRLRSFSAPGVEPAIRFRFGGDLLEVRHLSPVVSACSVGLKRIRK